MVPMTVHAVGRTCASSTSVLPMGWDLRSDRSDRCKDSALVVDSDQHDHMHVNHIVHHIVLSNLLYIVQIRIITHQRVISNRHHASRQSCLYSIQRAALRLASSCQGIPFSSFHACDFMIDI